MPDFDLNKALAHYNQMLQEVEAKLTEIRSAAPDQTGISDEERTKLEELQEKLYAFTRDVRLLVQSMDSSAEGESQ